MGYYDPDVLNQPEQFGLIHIGLIDRSDGSYQFNYVALWHNANGTVFIATDSGCSCPSPFENHTKIEDLDVLPSLTELDSYFTDDMVSEYESDRVRAELVELKGRLMQLARDGTIRLSSGVLIEEVELP